MRSSAVAFRPWQALPSTEAAQDHRERCARRRVGIAWGLLVLSVLTFYPKTWSGMRPL